MHINGKIVVVGVSLILLYFAIGIIFPTKTYHDSKFGVSFDIPRDWEVKDDWVRTPDGRMAFSYESGLVSSEPGTLFPATLDQELQETQQVKAELGEPVLNYGYTSIDGNPAVYTVTSTNYRYYTIKNGKGYYFDFNRNIVNDEEIKKVVESIRLD